MALNPSQGKPILEEDRTRGLLELLYHVSREFATALDLRTVLQRVLYESIQNVGGVRGSIVVLDDAGKAVDSTIVFGKSFREDTTQQLKDTVERGLAGWVVRNRKPALLADTSRDDRWLKRAGFKDKKSDSKSALCVPLLVQEKLVGVLTLVHSEPNSFGADHLELMQAIADQAGIAVLNARLYTESQHQARVMSALVESATAINKSLRLDEVLQRILNQTIHALQVETVALGLIDSASGELVFRAATGHKSENILNRHIPAGKGLAWKVIDEQRGVVISNVSQDKRFKTADKFEGIETRDIALTPIQTSGKAIGVLEAINPISDEFDSEALLVLSGLGSIAGTTIQNAQLFEKLETAHQHYRELFEDSIDPILLTDWGGTIIEANRKALDLIGYDAEQLRKIHIEKVHDINWEETGPDFNNLKPYQTCTYESNLHTAAGYATPVEVNVRPIKFEDADVLQWIMHNIRARKALDNLRNDLTAMVYHDLRSPLANVTSSLAILRGLVDAEHNETVESILKIASNSTSRIVRLINSLLDINRLELGQNISDQKEVNIVDLANEAIRELTPTVESRNQKLLTKYPKKAALIWVDEDMILRVLINLVENAAKFAPSESQITIAIKTKKEWVELSVHDIGHGISPKDYDRVFDKFTQLRGANKPGGLGIGLAFCRLAIEANHGQIWVESEKDKGTTFFLKLPVATKEQIAEAKGE